MFDYVLLHTFKHFPKNSQYSYLLPGDVSQEAESDKEDRDFPQINYIILLKKSLKCEQTSFIYQRFSFFH